MNHCIFIFRPNFFALCNPDMTSIDCGNLTHPQYVMDYTCQGPQEHIQSSAFSNAPWESKKVHMSFVSGHSSMAWQSATFCVLYIQSRNLFKNSSNRSVLIIPLVQLIIIILAYFTALTRVTDYWHHPGDVIGKTFEQIICKIFVLSFLS